MALSVAGTNAQSATANQAIAGLHARDTNTDSSNSPFAALLALLGNSQDESDSAESALVALQSLHNKSAKINDTAASDAASQLNAAQQASAQQTAGQVAAARSTTIVASSGSALQDILKGDAPAGASTQTTASDSAKQPNADSTSALTAVSQAKLVAALKAAADDKQTLATATDAFAQAASTPSNLGKLESAAFSHTSKQAEQAQTPASKTEAQALPIHFDSSNAKSNVQTGGDFGSNANGQNGNSHAARDQAADAIRSLDTANTNPSDASFNAIPNSNPAPATNLADATNGVSGIAGTAGPSLHVASELKISAQTSGDPTQPNLGALAVSIAAKSKDGEQQFNISMNPPELGRVDVKLSVDSTGKTQAHLTADQPQTLQLLQKDRTTLENSLKDAGLDLANNGLNFSLKGQDQQNNQNDSAFAQRGRSLSVNAIQSTDASNSISGTSFAPGDSRLDIRV